MFVMLVYIQVHVILVFPLPLTAADGPLCAFPSHACYYIMCSAVCNNFSLAVCMIHRPQWPTLARVHGPVIAIVTETLPACVLMTCMRSDCQFMPLITRCMCTCVCMYPMYTMPCVVLCSTMFHGQYAMICRPLH